MQLSLRILAPVHSFPGHADFSTFVALSNPPTHVISTGDDRTVRLWTLDRRRWRSRLLARTPDIGWKCALSADASVAAAACNDGAVRVWRVDAGAPPAPSLVLRAAGYDVAFGAALTDSGDTLVASFFCAASASGLLARYRLPSGRLERQWVYPMWWGRATVVISARCELIALATDTAFLVLDGVTGGRQIQRRTPVSDFDIAIAGVARRVVVASSECLKMYYIGLNKERELDGYLHPLTPSVSTSGDGRIIVAAQKGYAFAVWTNRSKFPVLALVGHSALVRGCAVSRDGAVVVGAGVDGSVRVWDLHAPTEEAPKGAHPVEMPTPCALHADASVPAQVAQGAPARPTASESERVAVPRPAQPVPVPVSVRDTAVASPVADTAPTAVAEEGAPIADVASNPSVPVRASAGNATPASAAPSHVPTRDAVSAEPNLPSAGNAAPAPAAPSRVPTRDAASAEPSLASVGDAAPAPAVPNRAPAEDISVTAPNRASSGANARRGDDYEPVAEDVPFARGRRLTESAVEAPRSRRSLPVEGDEGANEMALVERRFSESVLDRRRGATRGSRLLFAIDTLVKLGIESLGIKQ